MSFITDALQQVVGKIEVRTRYGPTLTLDDPFASAPVGTGPSGASILKPMIVLYPREVNGQKVADPITIAPYGDPGDTFWPFLVAGGGILLGWLAYRSFGRKV